MSAPRRARRFDEGHVDDQSFDDDHCFDHTRRPGPSGRAHPDHDDERRSRPRRPADAGPDRTDLRRSESSPDVPSVADSAGDADDDDGIAWSTYRDAERGPEPVPSWLVVDPLAIDEDRGVLKSGKEAEVSLVERSVRRAFPVADTSGGDGGSGDRRPADLGAGAGADRRRRATAAGELPGRRDDRPDRSGGTEPEGSDGVQSCLLAAKRYRSAEHRLFHRDAGYLEGRRVRRSREMRAMRTRTSFGRELIAGQWAAAEFAVLGRLWQAGAAVPYPVQLYGTELMMEFVGDADGTAAPRLAETAPGTAEARDLYTQMVDVLVVLAEAGYTHGDLSPYNVLNHHGRLVLIDLPQAVDLVGNPQGFTYLERDCANICRWFAARGVNHASEEDLVELLSAAAVSGRGR